MLIELSEMKHDNPDYTADEVIQGVIASVGAGGYTKTDLTHIQNLAVRLGFRMVRNFAEFYHELIDSTAIKMKPADMGAVAAIDETNAHVKVALLITLYLGVGSPASTVSSTATSAPKKEMLARLSEHVDYTMQFETFLKAWIGVVAISSDAVRNTRTSRADQHT